MDIVFTVHNNDKWNSIISGKFGRTEGFIRYSEENEKLSYHSNEENNTGHDVEIQAGQSVINLEADVVITGGSMETKAFELLKNAGVKIFSKIGEIPVKEAYEDLKKGRYNETLKFDKQQT